MLCLKYVSDPHIGFFGGESARFDEFSVPGTCLKMNSSDFVLGGSVEQLASCQKWYKIGKSIFYCCRLTFTHLLYLVHFL